MSGFESGTYIFDTWGFLGDVVVGEDGRFNRNHGEIC
jgi:hypothetical protein